MVQVTNREAAMVELQKVFTTQRAGEPVLDPYTFTWDMVEREPVNDAVRAGQKAVMAILEGPESKSPIIGQMEVNLRVFLEWTFYLDDGEQGATGFNRVLGEIQRRLREDIYLNQTVLNVVETGNEPDIDSPHDQQIGGTVFINILYKHAENDPRKYV